MTGIEYQKLAMRTRGCRDNADALNHAVFGLTSEAGEVASVLQKFYQGHGHPLKDLNAQSRLMDELGDCLWMIAEACSALGWTVDDAMRMNIRKLRIRYPDGFDEQRSIDRKESDEDWERARILNS